MKTRRMATRVAFTCVGAALFCASCMESTVEDDLERSNAHIKGGFDALGHTGLVDMRISGRFCTGWMLNERVVVTAAHCLPSDDGERFASIDYYHPTLGKLNVWADLVQTTRHPSYNPDAIWITNQAKHDIGVVYNNAEGGWQGTGYQDYLRVYQDIGLWIDWITAWGAGVVSSDDDDYSTAGTLRWMIFEVVNVHTYVLVTEASESRAVCGGDSGGPAIKVSDELEMVTGVLSRNNGVGVGGCTNGLGVNSQYYTRTIPDKLNWIASTTGSECTALNAHGYDYKRCFDVPFINEVLEGGIMEPDLLPRSLAVAIVMAVL